MSATAALLCQPNVLTCSAFSPHPTWARKFFENWRSAPKWQCLDPYEKFANMSDRHWDGIVAYCQPENQVALGFVEGLNNKIRVIQRRAYGLRDQHDLRLKVLTWMLPEILADLRVSRETPLFYRTGPKAVCSGWQGRELSRRGAC